MLFSWLGRISLAGSWLLAQGAGGGKTTTPTDVGIFGNLGPLLPMLLIGVVFYFLMMRPQQKKQKEQEKLLTALKKNDRVVTIGGIAGTVVNAATGSTFITIRVDDSNNTRLRILRTAVSRVNDDVADDDAPAVESK